MCKSFTQCIQPKNPAFNYADKMPCLLHNTQTVMKKNANCLILIWSSQATPFSLAYFVFIFRGINIAYAQILYSKMFSSSSEFSRYLGKMQETGGSQ